MKWLLLGICALIVSTVMSACTEGAREDERCGWK